MHHAQVQKYCNKKVMRGLLRARKGADTAIVARSTPTKEIFSRDSSRKLEARDIIVMPLKKEWW